MASPERTAERRNGWGSGSRALGLAAFLTVALVGSRSVAVYLEWDKVRPPNTEANMSVGGAEGGAGIMVVVLLLPAVPLAAAFPLQLLGLAAGIRATRRDPTSRQSKRWLLINALAGLVEMPAVALLGVLATTGVLNRPLISQWVALDPQRLVAASTIAKPEESAGTTSCSRDADCSPNGSCKWCGKCFAQQPVLQTDCKAECRVTQSCRCVQAQCVVATDSAH